MNEEIEEFNCDDKDYPVCPYCGTGTKDKAEWGNGNIGNNNGDTWEKYCNECEKIYEIITCVSYSFFSRKMPCANVIKKEQL